MIQFGLSAIVVDAETAFLYEKLEEISRKFSPSMKGFAKDDCLILEICIYGMRVVEILKRVGFIKDHVNPCLYMKKSMKCVVHVAFYVDDNLMIGNPEAKYVVV